MQGSFADGSEVRRFSGEKRRASPSPAACSTAAAEPPSQRARLDGGGEGGGALADDHDDHQRSSATFIDDHDNGGSDDEYEEAGAANEAGADVQRHWVNLNGCETLEEVRRVLHLRFQTSQSLLDYIQTYRDTRLLKIIPLLMQRPRHKLSHINSLDDVCNLVSTCKNILVLTGAGVSVSAGIPDFRSSDGIYRRLRDEVGHVRPLLSVCAQQMMIVIEMQTPSHTRTHKHFFGSSACPPPSACLTRSTLTATHSPSFPSRMSCGRADSALRPATVSSHC